MTEEQSFWTTVPGILTRIGGVIGAGAALVTALYSAGIIGNRATNNATPGVQTEEKEGDPEKKNNQDMHLEQAIIGTWRYTIKPPPSFRVADFDLLTTYLPDGKAIQRASPIYQGQMIPGKISGKWSIRYGILYYKVESSNVPFIEQGSTYEGKITSITEDQLTQINLADGQTTVSFRVK
jgi:hypothetical protein